MEIIDTHMSTNKTNQMGKQERERRKGKKKAVLLMAKSTALQYELGNAFQLAIRHVSTFIKTTATSVFLKLVPAL